MAKTCKTCGVEKPIEEFRRSNDRPSGYKGPCKACLREKQKAEIKANPERSRTKYKKWASKNREYLAAKERKRLEDPSYRLKSNISRRIRGFLNGVGKSKRTLDIIGCSSEELRNHLEATFEANYGMPREWLGNIEVHIDHIIPISTAKTEEEVYKLNHYSNLQLLFKEDNLMKSNRLNWEVGHS